MSKSDHTTDAPVNLAAENAQTRGELIPGAELHLTVASAIKRVRVKALAGLSEVVPDLIAARTAAEAEAIMEGALRGALDELAAVEAEFADDGPQAA